jgi:hypothetical protein
VRVKERGVAGWNLHVEDACARRVEDQVVARFLMHWDNAFGLSGRQPVLVDAPRPAREIQLLLRRGDAVRRPDADSEGDGAGVRDDDM